MDKEAFTRDLLDLCYKHGLHLCPGDIHKPSKAKPTEQEIIDFCKSEGLPASDGQACYNKWVGNGWKNGGAAVKCWKSTIRSWKLHGYLPSQKTSGFVRPQNENRI